MRAFVLAAGYGTRLRPLTEHLPKALVPVCGTSLLERTLALLSRHGFGPLAVNSHHLHAQMESYRRRSRYEFELYHEADQIRGIGGALHFARSFLEGGDMFCLRNVEPLIDLDLGGLAEKFAGTGAVCALVSVPVNDGGTIFYAPGTHDFLGTRTDMPIEGPHRQANYIGVAFCRKEFLSVVTPDDFNMQPIWHRARTQGCRVVILETDTATYWRDVGTPGELARVHFDLFDTEYPLTAPQNMVVDRNKQVAHPRGLAHRDIRRLGRYVWLGVSQIPEGCSLRRCVVLEGATLRAGVDYQDTVVTRWGQLPLE